MEVDLNFVKKNAKSAFMISNASIIVPFSLGILLAYYLYSTYALKGTSFLTFSIFLGIALSITAFPVLARILVERGITKTPLGIMTLTAAAANDITGWCLLACVIAIAKAGNILNAIPVLALSLIFVFAMLFLVRPLLKRAGAIYVSAENMSKTVVAFIILFVFTSAYFSDIIGIHALFGSFIAGIVMPNNDKFKKVLTNKIEDISVVLLLPLFFVFTGLRTQIEVINNYNLFLTCLLIIFVAVIGKLGGGFISARISGMNNKDSLSLGILMNTRGLMELIVLNIGYDMGILSTEIFTIFVIMALATTFMTGPSLNLIDYVFRKIDKIKEQKTDANRRIRILISFAKPEMGSKLLRLATYFTGQNNEHFVYSTIHITPSSELTSKSLESNENEIFDHINNTAKELKIDLHTYYKVSEDYTHHILKHTRKDNTDWLLVGSAKSLFTDSIIGGSIKSFLETDYMNVGVLIDHDFCNLNNCLIIIKEISDLFIFDFLLWLTNAHPNLKVKLAFFDQEILDNSRIELIKSFNANKNINDIELLIYNAFYKIPFTDNDLTITSLKTWKDFNTNKNAENIITSSILILKPKVKNAN